MRDNNILSRWIKPAGRKLEMPWVNWLVMRRSHDNWLRMAGADLKDRQAQMRHAHFVNLSYWGVYVWEIFISSEPNEGFINESGRLQCMAWGRSRVIPERLRSERSRHGIPWTLCVSH